MALADDFLKRAINPFRLPGLGGSLFRPKPSGYEPLNPEAAALRQQNLPAFTAQRLARQQATQPQQGVPRPQTGLSVAPRPSGGLTGGIQQPVDPANAQLQQEAANLAQYGSAIAPAQEQDTFDYQGGVYRTNPDGSATKVSGIGPQTLSREQALAPETPIPEAQAIEGQVVPPSPRFIDTYRNIYDQLGLGDIRSQIESTGTQLQELQDKKVDEISQVNENPWFTEGQRQDRVNAINRRYEQREGNLLNRIQLFQSTFEQGRQEAQFIASQTAQEQRAETEFQRGLVESQLEAERKLREKGEEILSVADARALGVPYGTTIAEARRLGVVPEAEEKLAPGIVGEYQFYAQQEQAAGRQPLSFDEYQTRDANRKLRAASAAGGIGDLTKLLTVEEALKLGVPYGTTKGEAVGLYAQGASGDAAKLRGIVNTLPSEITRLRDILQTADRKKLAGILANLDPTTNRLIDQVADKVGRLRSGGAINKDEEARFKGQLIRKADLLSGSTASAISALDGIAEEARQVAQGIRVTQPTSTSQTSGQTSSGLDYTIIP